MRQKFWDKKLRDKSSEDKKFLRQRFWDDCSETKFLRQKIRDKLWLCWKCRFQALRKAKIFQGLDPPGGELRAPPDSPPVWRQHFVPSLLACGLNYRTSCSKKYHGTFPILVLVNLVVIFFPHFAENHGLPQHRTEVASFHKKYVAEIFWALG